MTKAIKELADLLVERSVILNNAFIQAAQLAAKVGDNARELLGDLLIKFSKLLLHHLREFGIALIHVGRSFVEHALQPGVKRVGRLTRVFLDVGV